jgi:hypothetical protein
MCMFCRLLFVLLYLFFWPWCCLFFFDIRILITPLASSNSSYIKRWVTVTLNCHKSIYNIHLNPEVLSNYLLLIFPLFFFFFFAFDWLLWQRLPYWKYPEFSANLGTMVYQPMEAQCHITSDFRDLPWGLWVMVFNATFNNISVASISWRSVLLMEETGVPGENHRPTVSHWQIL